MTGNQSLVARTLLSTLIGGISVIVCAYPKLRTLPRPAFDRLVNIAFVVSRLSIFVGIFIVLHIAPRGDVPAFYWYEANSVIGHLLPYRDFESSYAPLHPYIDALVIHIWYSPLALILFSICVEALILPLWLRLGRVFLTEKEVRSSALLYLTSAVSVQFVAIDGHDNVLIALLLVLALIFAYRSHAFASGASVGFGVAAVKFLPLLYFPAFFMIVPRRWRWLAGALSIIVLVFGVCIINHLPVMYPLLLEGSMRSAGNIPFIFEGITGLVVASRVWDVGVLVVCLAIISLMAKSALRSSLPIRLRILTFGFAALTLALMLFSKKSWPPYLMLSLFPICTSVRSEKVARTAAFALFGVFAVLTMSYWATVFGQNDSTAFHRGLLAHQPVSLALLIMQLGLVVGYAWLLRNSLRQIADSRLPSELEA